MESLTLYDECKLALKKDFKELTIGQANDKLAKLNGYLSDIGNGDIDWRNENIQVILVEDLLKVIKKYYLDNRVVIITDTADVPIFETNLNLEIQQFNDIACLSHNIFLINENFIGKFSYSSSNTQFALINQSLILNFLK